MEATVGIPGYISGVGFNLSISNLSRGIGKNLLTITPNLLAASKLIPNLSCTLMSLNPTLLLGKTACANSSVEGALRAPLVDNSGYALLNLLPSFGIMFSGIRP